MAAYVSSKAGIIGFTKSLALDLGPKGITVNNIPPGMVVTPMLEKAIDEGRFTASLDHFAKITPVRRSSEDMMVTPAKDAYRTDGINVFQTILELRGQRRGMVQTSEQYAMIYYFIHHWLNSLIPK